MRLHFLTTMVALTLISAGTMVGCNESTSKPNTAPAPLKPVAAKESAPTKNPPETPPASAATPTTAAPETMAPPVATPKAAVAPTATATASAAAPASENTAAAEAITEEWRQWGGSSVRNNTPVGKNIPSEWALGGFDLRTGAWKPEGSKNMKWVAKLGSETYGNLAVAGGKVFVGTNNAAGWIERFPGDHDLGCLLCFDIKDGKFLWQHSSEKLPTGRVHDWPEQGVCSGPYIEGNRLWYVTNRGEVRCLDTEGFYDGENDGPYVDEETELKASGKPYDLKKEADVIWVFDMMKELRISQHNMCSCSITAVGDVLFICTSNGQDVEHNYIPAPDAPSFFAMNKNTKEVLWTDNSPGLNILHGQWSSPSYAVLGGQPQIIFAGGDGWLRSFDPQGDGNGKSKLLWEFDCNPKTSFYTVNASATRNHLIATPVIYEGLIYIAVGEDPEHDEGIGHLWCIDPTKRGDVSAELAFKADDRSKPLPHRRLQAVVEEDGEIAVPNPNSAAVWHYSQFDQNGDGKVDFDETMHRTMGSVAIKDDILYIADFSGIFHCLDAKTGKPHWSYDMLGQSWGSPLIVDGKVYMGDADGEVAVFRHSADPAVAMKDVDGERKPYYGEINMNSSVYTTPIVAGNVLYMTSMNNLFAIESKAESSQ